MSAIRFSFLIPTRGNPSGLAKLFRSLQENTRALGELEVVLAIDEDDAESRAVDAPGVQIKRVMLPRGHTMGALNNACYAASEGRFVMVMNDDVVIRTEGWDRRVGEVLATFPDDIALIHVNDLLFRERLCTFPIVSRRACEEVGLCPTTYRRYKIDDHIYDIYSLLAFLGHRRIVYLPDVVFEHENHVPAHVAGGAHAHVFTSAEGKVYVPKKEIVELDDQVFLAALEERKTAALRLAGVVEATRQRRALAVRAAGQRRRLHTVRDPYAHRRASNVRTQSAIHRPSSKEARTTIVVVTGDLRNDHTRQCLARIKEYTQNYDLVVLDNTGSQDFSHPRVMNQALRNVETDYVVLMDDDVFVEPGWLDGLLGCIDADTGVVAPLHTDCEGKLSFSGLYLSGDGRGTHEHTFDRPAGPRVMQSYCSAILLIDMTKCGHILMDEGYSKYFFDLVHGFEVWEAGYQIVCTPEVSVTHLGGATMNWGSAESNDRLAQDRATFIREWVETGRLKGLEDGIWQRHPYIRNLCEIPRRIAQHLNASPSMDRASFRTGLETLRKDCQGYRLFQVELHRQLREAAPQLYTHGAADLAEECVEHGILSTAYGNERECLVGINQALLAGGRAAEAASLMTRVVGRFPEDPTLLREYGLALVSTEHLPEALRTFLAVLERAPDDVEALASLGTVAERLGRRAEARECFAAALALIRSNGSAGDAYAGLARRLAAALAQLDGDRESADPTKASTRTSPARRETAADVRVRKACSPDGEDAPGPGCMVSAIVSTYNAERFLRGCLEDLEAQTIRNRLEIIVIDSGSDQNERGIVEEFQRCQENIRYVRTERENHHAALNRGIAMARGTYVTMANTDDRHAPDAFERMVAALEARPDVALVYADSVITDQENAVLETARILGHLRLPAFDRRLLFRGCSVGPQPMWRRDLHDRYGYFDPEFEICGDYEFWLRIGVAETFHHIPEVLGLYFMSPTSNERVNRIQRHQETERARQKHWPAAWGELPPWDADYNVMLACPTTGQPSAMVSGAGRMAHAGSPPASIANEEDDMRTGHLALEQQAWPQACDAFIRVLERDKNCAPARSGLGLALMALGDATEGMAQLQEAVRLEPNPDHVCNLASGLIHVGRQTEAERLLRGILEVVPAHEAARANLDSLRHTDSRPALPESSATPRPVGTDEIARRLEMAADHMVAKRWREAVDGFRAVLAVAPDLAEARAALGSVLLVLGRSVEAVGELRRAAERLNTSVAWNNLGWAQSVAGQADDARRSLIKAIESDPTNLEPQRNLAALFETLEMPREAAAAYDLILLTTPGDPEALKGKLRCGERPDTATRPSARPAGEMVLLHG